jgi:hypothetical protein
MQTMERLAQPQPLPQLPFQPQPTFLPTSLPSQPNANLYETTIQQTKQLREKSKLVRPTYVKVRFANSRDWAKWKINTRGYMTSLQIPNILSASYEAPTKEIFEYAIYDIQNTLFNSLILETVEQGHHYLLQEKLSARDQYEILREYFDLRQHAQYYYAMKKFYTHRYITKEAALATITAFGTRMREANVRIIDQLLLYAYMILISHGYDTAINSLLTDKPHSMETPTWTLKIITKYFAMKHESKPRDYGPKKQNSSSNKQDSSSKKQEKKQESTSNTEADSHDGQQKRQKNINAVTAINGILAHAVRS